MFERHVGPAPDDDVTRPLPLTGGPAGLSGDEAGYVSYEGRHRAGRSRRAGVRTAAAAALFSVPTGGLAAAVLAPPSADTDTRSLRADLASNATDLGTASMALDRQASPTTSFAPVAAPTSGADIVHAQIVEEQKLPIPERVVQDPTLEEGTRTVVDPGRAGERSVLWRVTYDQGREVARERIGAGQDTPAAPRVVKVGTKEKVEEVVEKATSSAPEVSGGGTWDKLAECESGGDWSTNTGNGYSGGLQFDKQTWQSYGGDEYAPTAGKASREEQIAVAEKVKDDRGGYSAWPSCSSKLGLS